MKTPINRTAKKDKRVHFTNLRVWKLLGSALLGAPVLHGQPVITASDMFNQVGQYYLAYANNYNPLDPSSTFPCAHLMGTVGGPQLWDFSSGPTNQVFRYDYLLPGDQPGASSFPSATIAERKTVVVPNTNEQSWLFFSQVPNTGRKVYGFYDATFSASTPDNVFSTPIVDFPNEIRYNDSWTTSFTIFTTIDVPIIDTSFPAQITYSSDFKADAYGTVDLPSLSFGPVLRINESQTIGIAVDLDGMGEYQNIETDYTRNYYWLSPGKGIVAQLNSSQNSTPPPDDFDLATVFTRMFETNHKLVDSNTGPSPVTDLRIAVNQGQVLLKWTAPSGTRQYRVEYSNGSFDVGSWKTLSTLTNQVFQLDLTSTNRSRFYRIVSLQ